MGQIPPKMGVSLGSTQFLVKGSKSLLFLEEFIVVKTRPVKKIIKKWINPSGIPE
jgi:hypothetical protein